MAKYAIEDTTLTALANKVRAKTGTTDTLTPDGTMLTALDALPDADALVADEPTTFGQMACLARVKQMRDIVFTPVGALPYNGGTYPAGEPVTGLPYSSVRLTDKFIGFNVSLHTFMTALNNPRSVLYTKTSSSGAAKTWYGTNCSTFVSYVYDWIYHNATAIFPTMDCVEEIDPADMMLCDAANVVSSTGQSGGHVVIITGITRNADGTINSIEISESDGIKVSCKTMTYSAFISSYIDYQGYKVYRNKALHDTSYTPSPFIPLFDEPTDAVTYSDLCTDLGDEATINTSESITLQPLVTDGYESIVLYKDGEQIDSYAVEDVELSGLAAGKYTAKMGDAKTSFIVTNVSVSQEGIRHTFGGTGGTPIRIVFKDTAGFTYHAVDLTEDDLLNGYKDIEYTNTAVARICVPFKNEYGFVVAECLYSADVDIDTSTDESVPEEYQKVAYIETDGDQYIDTGVNASEHTDVIRYKFVGNVTGYKVASGNNYLFGCLADNSRSGNMGVNEGSLLVFIGGNSYTRAAAAMVDVGTDFEAYLEASSKDPNNTVQTLNGTALTIQNSASEASDMPDANIYLFSAYGVAATNGKYWGKLYSFTMTAADGTPLRSFVPCYRVADGVIGLYDTVGGVFYENSGTGSFQKGADV